MIFDSVAAGTVTVQLRSRPQPILMTGSNEPGRLAGVHVALKPDGHPVTHCSNCFAVLRSATLVLVAILTLPALGGCGASDAEARRDQRPSTPAALVELGPVQVGSIERRWTAVGSLRADESVIVRPEITGRIIDIGFQEGQQVSKGAMLFALDASVFEAEVAQARANLALAERNARRAEELYERQLIPTAERDTTVASLDVNRAALQLAQAQAAKTVIRAPFSGRAGLRSAAIGDYVNPGQDLVTIEDLSRIELEFRLPELATADVRTGQSLQVELDAYPGERFAGTLYAIDSRVAEDTRSFAARARLDNVDGRLRPGLFARVSLVVERQDDALLVPEQSIVMRGERAFVFRVRDGKAQQLEIRVGQRRDGQAQVLSGLTAGESIVVSGIQRVADGSVVRVAEPAAEPARQSRPNDTPQDAVS